MARSLNPEFTINGDFGYLYDEDGRFISSVQEVSGQISVNREEIMRSGTRVTGYKATSITGTGSIRRFKVTSDWVRLIGSSFSDGSGPVAAGQLIVKLDDPASLGTERLLLKNVKFWEIDFGWTVGSIIEENVDFTFEGFEVLDAMEGDPTITASRFEAVSA
ncbi:MAG: phage tail tube protein [Candidatus Poribacteria bacterium]|nr:phage tail tube protein [Candidatus Poribacteria bacterium]